MRNLTVFSKTQTQLVVFLGGSMLAQFDLSSIWFKRYYSESVRTCEYLGDQEVYNYTLYS